MSKPEWKDAPEWANWLAHDDDIASSKGRWVFFAEKPEIISNGRVWSSGNGKWLETEFTTDGIDHIQSLEPRQ